MNKKTGWLLFALLGLSACGGGGGGGAIRSDPFVSFAAINPNQTVQASAIAQTAVATVDMNGNVTSRGLTGVHTEDSTVTLSYSPSLDLTRVAISNPDVNLTWSGPSQISCGSSVCTTENSNSVGVAINPFDASLNWNYQTLGFWILETGLTTGKIGVMSMGNPTPAGAIPIAGTAAYSGMTTGVYVNQSGLIHGYSSTMSATANFGTGTVAFSTSGTQIVALDTMAASFAPTLDLTGSLAITSGQNLFSGTVSNPEGMTGSATGRFYGPVYEEIGGVFGLMQGSTQSLIGAFGGKQ